MFWHKGKVKERAQTEQTEQHVFMEFKECAIFFEVESKIVEALKLSSLGMSLQFNSLGHGNVFVRRKDGRVFILFSVRKNPEYTVTIALKPEEFSKFVKMLHQFKKKMER